MGNRNGINILGIIAIILVVSGFAAFYLWDSGEQQKEIAEFQRKDKIDNEKAFSRSKIIADYLQDVQKMVEDDINGMIMIGDDYISSNDNLSLKSQLNRVIESKLFYDLNLETYSAASLEKYQISIPIENHAVSSEDYNTILARLGIKPLFVAKDFTVPAGTDKVLITFKTENDIPVVFSAQDNERIGTTVIDNIEGGLYLSRTENDNYDCYFGRSQSGEEKKIAEGARVKTESTDYSKDQIPIIFFGNNDYVSVDAYVKTQKAIADRQTGSGGRYMVIANTDEDSELDKAMQKEFGENYIRINSTNISSLDYEATANIIYNQMNKLGYFNHIKEKVTEAKEKIKEYDHANS